MNRIVVSLFLAAAAAPAAAQQCTLEYQRADNMFAAPGRPDGALGAERLTLEPGQTKVFITDWKYEKQRNDGTNYYGSHMRIVQNAGRTPIRLVFRGDDLKALANALRSAITQQANKSAAGLLDPGARILVRADLMEASCPAEQAKATVNPPAGLSAKQVSPTQIVLTWEPVPGAKEYNVYVSGPGSSGRPGVIGGNGSRWVITVPPSVPAAEYRASIETVAANGAKSKRVDFNPVAFIAAPGGPGGMPQTGGGPLPGGTGSTPATPGAGQQCPAGQFVTGFTSAGALICATPPR